MRDHPCTHRKINNESGDLVQVQLATQKMSTLSLIQVLRLSLFKFYFLFTIVGLIFIRFYDKSKQEILQSTQ